jgi:hypothetical protein
MLMRESHANTVSLIFAPVLPARIKYASTISNKGDLCAGRRLLMKGDMPVLVNADT